MKQVRTFDPEVRTGLGASALDVDTCQAARRKVSLDMQLQAQASLHAVSERQGSVAGHLACLLQLCTGEACHGSVNGSLLVGSLEARSHSTQDAWSSRTAFGNFAPPRSSHGLTAQARNWADTLEPRRYGTTAELQMSIPAPFVGLL